MKTPIPLGPLVRKHGIGTHPWPQATGTSGQAKDNTTPSSTESWLQFRQGQGKRGHLQIPQFDQLGENREGGTLLDEEVFTCCPGVRGHWVWLGSEYPDPQIQWHQRPCCPTKSVARSDLGIAGCLCSEWGHRSCGTRIVLLVGGTGMGGPF